MKWIAMYSQTGSEIVDICENIKRKPNLILTNNIIFNQRVLDLNVPIAVNKHDVLMNYLRYNSNILKSEKVLITLHGYLRDRKSTRLNSSHSQQSRMPSSA